ncbi:hypothetical protein Tco_1555577 [Tanacetum coccineum]
MACSLSHNIDEIQALVYKLMDDDKARQKVILELAVQFDNACTAKDDLRKTYEKCNDILQESRAFIDTFLKEEYDKDYEIIFRSVGPVTATHQGEIHVVLGLILTLFNRVACSWTAGILCFYQELSRAALSVVLQFILLGIWCCCSLSLVVGVIWFVGLDVTPLGANRLEVSREGYLEVVAELNCKDNVYSHCLRVNTYFALAIVE